jgi:hypothetical protein
VKDKRAGLDTRRPVLNHQDAEDAAQQCANEYPSVWHLKSFQRSWEARKYERLCRHAARLPAVLSLATRPAAGGNRWPALRRRIGDNGSYRLNGGDWAGSAWVERSIRHFRVAPPVAVTRVSSDPLVVRSCREVGSIFEPLSALAGTATAGSHRLLPWSGHFPRVSPPPHHITPS